MFVASIRFIKINSPPSSPAFFIVPYCGSVSLLCITAVLKLINNSSAGRYFFVLFFNLFTRNSINLLWSGTSFRFPLVMAFLLGKSYSGFISCPSASSKALLVLKILPLKQASAISNVCFVFILLI